MGFGLVITSGDDHAQLPESIAQWLVEVRVEMELSRATRFALRFEDDICGEQPAVEGRDELAANRKIGIFVPQNDTLECLVHGPITEVRSSSTLGGVGSWVEIHGEDRRIEMGRVGIQETYTGKASAAAETILSAYQFTPDTQDTLIEYDEQQIQLSQRGTDLAFLEEIARRNNMEFWISYEANRAPMGGTITLTETANLRTSPPRTQPGGRNTAPQIPILTPMPARSLPVSPPPRRCPGVNKFQARIDYEKPTAALGFAMNIDGENKIIEQIVSPAEPNPDDPTRLGRQTITPPEVTAEEAFLAKDGIVFEQSWFVEVECSTTLEQAGFVILPHQIIDFSHAGDRLSGAYQVMKAIHVINATDHLIDFTVRANGLGGAS
ncbi:hypothetical protein [Nitrosospira sp. Nsp13]|uniref:hypothetical protein n=1 Tax=Nitrosospira sp. Nsp13 TaxID=1855332 RepID=UPI000888F8BD|nr:hypothetical protein [Nitrosospira sp. Nsp13]SCX79677.1 hypothetical protein SAMN05216308_101284 [Nitrosospira sp. Nsp13]